MSAVLTKLLGDLRQRRLQAVVLTFILPIASGTTAMGLTPRVKRLGQRRRPRREITGILTCTFITDEAPSDGGES